MTTDIRLTDIINTEGLDLLKYVKEHSPETMVIILANSGCVYRNLNKI